MRGTYSCRLISQACPYLAANVGTRERPFLAERSLVAALLVYVPSTIFFENVKLLSPVLLRNYKCSSTGSAARDRSHFEA